MKRNRERRNWWIFQPAIHKLNKILVLVNERFRATPGDPGYDFLFDEQRIFLEHEPGLPQRVICDVAYPTDPTALTDPARRVKPRLKGILRFTLKSHVPEIETSITSGRYRDLQAEDILKCEWLGLGRP